MWIQNGVSSQNNDFLGFFVLVTEAEEYVRYVITGNNITSLYLKRNNETKTMNGH